MNIPETPRKQLVSAPLSIVVSTLAMLGAVGAATWFLAGEIRAASLSADAAADRAEQVARDLDRVAWKVENLR